MRGIEGKVAFVTGAVRQPGMGRQTALRLAEEGADVVCVDAPATVDAERSAQHSDTVTAGALDQLADDICALGRRALAIEVDLTDEEAVARAVDGAVSELGRIDFCCHLAGGTGPELGTGPLLDIDEAAFDRCLAANLVSPWLVAQACAAAMVRQGEGGSIVLLSSFAARNTPERYGAFSAARAGIIRLVEVLGQELATAGIRANAVLPLGVSPDAPGAATNPGLDDLLRSRGQDIEQFVAREVPLGRLQAASETASVVAFLCSDDASFVSGQAIAVSGGAVR
jgi:NAD(P)-dependent dehydrogenase (short-subunit alcohol dehydrogenase family)